jgi:hypothetical protein
VVIGEQIVAKWVPLVWGAFLDFQRHGIHLSRIEGEVLVALIGGSPDRARAIAESNGLVRVVRCVVSLIARSLRAASFA